MNHNDHVRLLRDGVPANPTGGSSTWADLGSGAGAFTLALAELLSPGSHIYAVDKDASALREMQRQMKLAAPTIEVASLTADFTQPLPLPALDSLVMANSLHFIPHGKKDAVLQRIKGYLKPHGHFILVEYNVDRGNMWVPYPLSYTSWEQIAKRNGFTNTHQIGAVPSHFLGQIYSAVSDVA